MVVATLPSRYRLLPWMAVCLLASCATQLPPPGDPPALPEAFSATGQQLVASTWWQAFDDPGLNHLVARALEDNLSLQAAYQRLLQAQAVARRQEASRFPTLDATAGAERQVSDAAGTTTLNVGLGASYEVDLWGRVQALADAEQLRASASEADYQAAAISLSGEIANTWFQWLEQHAQRQLAENQLATNRNVLTVIETRFGTGMSSSADVLRQRQLVEASDDRLNEVAAEITVLENQLAVLQGMAPGQISLPDAAALPDLPPLPATGVPASLLLRRPDLQQQWLQIQAADRDLAAAISNQFPRFSIEASISTMASDPGALFNRWLSSLAGNLLAPVVDGGERRANVSRAEAARNALVRDYGQAVLIAIREVEDALTREQQLRERLASLDERIDLADATLQQLRTRYLNGAASYLDVLDALQGQQDLSRTRLTTRQQMLVNRVALYRALAGRIDLPTPAAPSSPAGSTPVSS